MDQTVNKRRWLTAGAEILHLLAMAFFIACLGRLFSPGKTLLFPHKPAALWLLTFFLSLHGEKRRTVYIGAAGAGVSLVLAVILVFLRGDTGLIGFSFACKLLLELGLGVLAAVLMNRKGRPEQLFPCIALILGLFFALLMTPLSIPDELFHYRQTLQCSDYLMFHWGGQREIYAAYFDFSGLTGHVNTAEGLTRVLAELFRPLENRETILCAREAMAYPIEFIPQAIGVSIGRLLRCNFITVFFLGRVAALVFYVLCLRIAIRRTPRHKMLFGLVGVSPMVLHQTASLSYDNWIIALGLVYLASLFKAMWEEGPLPRRDILWAVISGMLFSPARAVNVLMLLLFLLIPARRLGGKRRKLLWTGILLLGSGFLVLTTQFETLASIGSAAAEDVRNWDGGVNYTVSYILENPGNTIGIFWRSLTTMGVDWFAQAHGWVLSGLSMPLRRWYPLGCAVLLFLTASARRGEPGVSLPERGGFLLVTAMVVGASMLAMFLAWTSDTRPVIDGVQGRYFIPLLLPAYLTVSGHWLPWRGEWDKYTVWAGAFLGAEILFCVLNYTVYR